MGYAFISYSSHDQAHADSLRAMLDKKRIKSWIAPYDIPAGSKYAAVVPYAIRDCSCLVVILTENTQNSASVLKELEYATKFRKAIIPIQLEDFAMNSGLALYIRTKEIISVEKIEESEEMKKAIRDVENYTGCTLKKANSKDDEACKNTDSENPQNEESGIHDYTNYRVPPVELLNAYEDGTDSDAVWQKAKITGEKIISLLKGYGINAVLCGFDCGPRLTCYQVSLKTPMPSKRFKVFEDDLALELCVQSVRIVEPLPRDSVYTIEIPNESQFIVSMRKLIESDVFQNYKPPTGACIGRCIDNRPIYFDIANMPHLLIAGAVGMGKSTCIATLITSVLYKARPDEVKFLLIDLKKTEFNLYHGLPHLLVPIITEAKDAVAALTWIIKEVDRRFDLFESLRLKSLDFYNARVTENPELGKPMPKIIIVIDELEDLMVFQRDSIERLLMYISQKARAAGMHLIISTQRPTPDVLTGVIRANIPSKIAFKVSSGLHSRCSIDMNGAEKLIGKGDMLMLLAGKPLVRAQGAFVSYEEECRIVEFIKAETDGTDYNRSAMAFIEKKTLELNPFSTTDSEQTDDESYESLLHDPKFLEAVRIAIDNGSVRTALLQRKLYIGYTKAAAYIDEMANLGLIEEKDGMNPRKVCVTMDEWLKKLKRLISNQ